MTEIEKKIAELKNHRKEIRATKDLQAGLIAEARKAEYEPQANVKEAARHCSKLEHELKDLREAEDYIDCDIAELMEEIREEKRSARRAKRQAKAAKDLQGQLDQFVEGIDMFVNALERVVDNQNCAERIGNLMAKVAGVAAGTVAKCEKAAKEATQGQPAMTTVS